MSEIKYGNVSKCCSCKHRDNRGPNWVCKASFDRLIGEGPMPHMDLPHLYPQQPEWCPIKKNNSNGSAIPVCIECGTAPYVPHDAKHVLRCGNWNCKYHKVENAMERKKWISFHSQNKDITEKEETP